MNELIGSAQGATMSSLEIAVITGKAHNDVKKDVRRILEECEIDLGKFSHIQKNHQNQDVEVYNLPKRECTLIVAGYSAKYRLAIIDRWIELESKLNKPMSHLEVSLKLLQEQERQGVQLVALTAKVDAMQESYFSVQGYANLHKIKIDHVTCNKLGRKSSKMSREDGAKIGKAKHQIFGEVNTYHEDILKDVFDEWLVSAL